MWSSSAAPASGSPITSSRAAGTTQPDGFGPKDYIRGTGQPVVVTDSFNVAAPGGGYRLCITNGGLSGQYPRVSSAVVTLNDAVVVKTNEFNKNVATITKHVALLSRNVLRVEVRSEPGSGFTLQIGGCLDNRAPVADAGPDQTVKLAEVVQLDGSRSTDPDGDPLTYQWSFVSKPTGSAATFSDPRAVRPTFQVDKAGLYLVQLQVGDGLPPGEHDDDCAANDHGEGCDRHLAQVVISTQNSKPVANAGPDQTILVQQPVTLDGSKSSDVDGDRLTFTWTFVSRPSGSGAAIQQATSANPTFVPDRFGDYVVRLVVNDGSADSVADTVKISTVNSPPVANAGAQQTARVGQTIVLDGSGSTDVDGDPLAYSWSLLSKPSGSTATLHDAKSVNPSVVIDVAGDYVVQLIVNDGRVDSEKPSTVMVSTRNSPPVANAGPDQVVVVGGTVRLNGSGSTDVDGNRLTFYWSIISKPQGSTAALSDPSIVNPTFVLDRAGGYIAQLIVNDGTVDSAPDNVTIASQNQPPVANAGPAQTVALGTTVHLDGRASGDPDGDALRFFWSLLSKPEGSTTALSGATSSTPAFMADKRGTYVVQLIVNDGLLDSAPTNVVISTENSVPIAKAGPDLDRPTGSTVQLDGGGSFDPDGSSLFYFWSLLSKPDGSAAALSNASVVSPTFLADKPGLYVAQLIVGDSSLVSAPDTVSVTISTVTQQAPAITSANGTTFTVGTPGTFTVLTTGFPTGATMVISEAGALPSPVTFTNNNNGTATLAGTPAAGTGGTYPITITANNGVAPNAVQNFTLTVDPGNRAPTITSTAVTAATVGQPYSYDVNATDPDAGDALTYSLTTFPTGMTIDPATGLIAWTPTANQTGARDVTVQVSDGHAGGTATQSFTVQVVDPNNRAPRALADSYTIRADQTLTVPVPGVLGNDSDPNNDPIFARKLTDPTRGTLAFDANGSFSYSPSAANLLCSPPPPPAGISFIEPFNAPLTFTPIGASVKGLARGDFNHDGFLDLAATGDNGTGTFFVWTMLGNGDGTFQPPVILRSFAGNVSGYEGILALDVDGDGHLDLFVTERTNVFSVLFFKGHGDGTFDAAVRTPMPQGPFLIQSADVNGDGKRDFVTLNSGNTVSVLLGDGTGALQSPVTYPAGAGSTDLALGDVNGDGAPDIVVSSSFGGNRLDVLLNTNTGTGTFGAPRAFPMNMFITGFYLADFNGDGKLDVVAGGFNCAIPNGGGGCMAFIPGNGDGTFPTPANPNPNAVHVSRPQRNFSENVAPDVDGDGKPDVVFGSEQAGTRNEVNIGLSNGDGTFRVSRVVASPGPVAGVQPASIQGPDNVSAVTSPIVADFNGDGVMDIVAPVDQGPGRVAFIPGTTPGKFAAPRVFSVLETSPSSFCTGCNSLAPYPVTLGNFTSSGQLELAVLGSFNRVGVMPIASDGSLGSVHTGISLGGSQPAVRKILSADFDRDGNLDVVWIGNNNGAPRLYVAYGNGAGQFTNPVEIAPSGNTAFSNIVLGDFNNDGFPDFAAYTGLFAGAPITPVAIDIYLSTGGGRTFTRLSPAGGSTLGPLTSSGANNSAMVAADFDRDGVLDLVISHGVNLATQADPQQTLFLRGNGDGTFQPAVVIASGITGGFVDYAAGDINHDGKVDLVGIATFSGVQVQLGNGDGTFQAPVSYEPGNIAGSLGQVALADFDSDGHLDIVAAMSGLANTKLGVMVLPGRGDGTFGAGKKLATGNNATTALIVADVNNDGRPDIIAARAEFNGGHLTVLLNNSATLSACTFTDHFTYAASDGSLDSPPVTVRITIQPVNHPPVITSTPVTTAGTGEQYSYDVSAVDQDAGDTLAFGLVTAPSGMTMTSDTGLIQWRPAVTQAGPHAVKVRVYDSTGAFAEQTFTLTVIHRVTVPNVVGQTQAAAQTTITGAGLTVGTITSHYSPTVPAGNVISQSPLAGVSVAENSAVSLVVSLGPLVVPGLTAITVTPSNPAILVGGTQTFTAIGVLSGGGTVDVTEGVAWSSGTTSAATISALGVATGVAAGTSTITATLSSVNGSATLIVRARVTGDTTLPIATITLVDGAEVTSPLDVIGTATDANFFRYELSYALAGETDFTLLATGSGPITNGVLGRFDPTLLINDLYDLKLTVFDLGGNESVATTTVQVSGNRKVGMFSLTYLDLNVPAVGIPLTVSRTYDSRDKTKGDFGIGWRLGLQTLRIRTNRVLGTGWVRTVSGPVVSLAPTSEHKVSVTLPDGRVEEFDMIVSPTSNIGSLDFTNVTGFQARAGTFGQLQALANNNLLIVNGGAQEELVDDSTLDTYAPKLYRYTTVDGTKIEISPGGGVKKVTDPNGNAVTFGPGGILHSNGTGIVFTRDAKDRIVAITDLLGNVQTYGYDGNGDLVTHTNAVGGVSRFTYDRNHGLIEARDAMGNQAVRSEYDASGRLTAVIDAKGNRVTFTHNDATREDVVTDRRGNVQRLSYDDQGNVLTDEQSVTIGGTLVNAITTKSYDGLGNTTSQTDPDGRRVGATYSGVRTLTQVTDPGGLNLTTSFAYNVRNDVTSAIDPGGRNFAFTYDASGNVIAYDTPLSGTATSTGNAQGQPVSSRDALGNSTVSTRNAAGQVSREDVLDAASMLLRRTDFAYNANGYPTSVTIYRTVGGTLTPSTTLNGYDAANRVTSVTDAAGGILRIEYDASGRVIARVDALGRRTAYSFDAIGQPIRTTFADGTSESVAYDASGNVASETDRAGRTTTHMYDELNRRVSSTRPDGSSTQTIYSPGGRVAARIDANGNRTDYAYDMAGRRTSTTLPAVANGTGGGALVRPQVATALNALGAPISATDASGRVTTFQYDANGRLTKTTHPDGSTMLQTYDTLGRRTSVTNEEGETTTFGYDGLGRLISVAGLAGDATYAYDEAGNMVKQIDALGRTTAFRYDALNRMVEKTYPGGDTEQYAYDAVGNLAARIDGLGRTIMFAYDAMNRLVAKTLPGGVTITYSYKPDGQPATVTDPRGITTLGYDSVGRLASVTHPTGETVSYARDANGNLLSLASPAATVNYGYDALNRLLQVNSPEGQSSAFYDLVGNRVRQTAANGIVTDMSFDNRNRPTSLTHKNAGNALLQSFANVYSPAGRRSQVTEQDGSVEAYTYDPKGRLSAEVRTGSNPFDITHSYDAVGNRTQMVRDGAPTVFTYDTDDRLLSDGTSTYSYDANGNLVTRTNGPTVTQYGYDAEGRLITVIGGGLSNQYTYDADGNRVLANTASGLVRFLVDDANNTGLAQILEERNGGGSLLARYSYGNELMAMARGGSSSFLLRDVHGSTRGLADATETITDSYAYDAYGNAVAATGSTVNPYRYGGERLDSDTGLYQLRNRYYNPALGRFMSRDPFSGRVESPVSRHRYQFANSDPVNHVDPTGRETLAEVLVAGWLSNTIDVATTLKTVHAACGGLSTLEQVNELLFYTNVGIQLAIGSVAVIAGTYDFGSVSGFKSVKGVPAAEIPLLDVQRYVQPRGRVDKITFGLAYGGGRIGSKGSFRRAGDPRPIEISVLGPPVELKVGAGFRGATVPLAEFGACGSIRVPGIDDFAKFAGIDLEANLKLYAYGGGAGVGVGATATLDLKFGLLNDRFKASLPLMGMDGSGKGVNIFLGGVAGGM